MSKPSSVDIARMMIRRHGLQAQAVAMERAAEMRQQGDISGLDHWESANAAIRELRRTAPSRQASRHASRGEATA